MKQPNKEAKEKLLQATLEILDEGTDPEKITTRYIAEKAGVGNALVNYYFQSKDNLIEQAIGIKMKGITDEMYDRKNASDNPVENLRSMIKQIAELSIRYRYLMKKAILFELKNGSYSTVQTILPILKDIFQGKKTEQELELFALQLLLPLQTMYAYPEIYQENLGWDLFKLEDSYYVVNVLIDNLFPEQNKTDHERT